jgi:hypothetical protein
MPTHAELAGKLLNDAATFFRTLASQNEPLRTQMEENASVFEQMATLVTEEPAGVINDKSHGELAGRLLKDAAAFFRTLADQNAPLKDQMEENARIFQQIGELVSANPLGILE